MTSPGPLPYLLWSTSPPPHLCPCLPLPCRPLAWTGTSRRGITHSAQLPLLSIRSGGFLWIFHSCPCHFLILLLMDTCAVSCLGLSHGTLLLTFSSCLLGNLCTSVGVEFRSYVMCPCSALVETPRGFWICWFNLHQPGGSLLRPLSALSFRSSVGLVLGRDFNWH